MPRRSLVLASFVVFAAGGLLWAAPAAPPPTADAGATPAEAIAEARQGPLAVALAPGGDALGVHRDAPIPLAEGQDHEAPAVATASDGTVVVVFVSRAHEREHLTLRRSASSKEAPAASAPLALGPARALKSRARVWHPSLAAGPDRAVWLAWCEGTPARGVHDRRVMLRKVSPGRPGKAVVVSRGRGRFCDPDVAVAADGKVYVAYEAAPGTAIVRTGIALRAFDPKGRPLGPPDVVSDGPFDRRPVVAVDAAGVHVAYDSLVSPGPTGALDPDYDVRLRSRHAGAWGPVVDVDAGPGIQAAPDVAPDGRGGLLVAYHTTEPWGLVKWWALRRVVDGRVEILAENPPGWARAPEGESQGAELPALAVAKDGTVFVVTRPSQGAFLHVVDAEGVRRPLDLTRRGWGARGQRTQVAMAADGALLVVRRARQEAVLERFTFDGSAGPPAFRPAPPSNKTGTALVPREARTVGEGLGKALSGRRVLLGDVHMHSAASDGTGPPDEILARAWVRGLDFAVLTDHDYVVGSRMALSEHDEIAWLTDLFGAKPGFTTLHGYEWTTPPLPGGFGHRNVYFRGEPPTRVFGYKDGFADTKALNRALRRERAFTAPHHTAWTGTDWENDDEKIQRQLEIVSVHGAFARPGDAPIPPRGEREGMFAVDGLARGLKFGFLGGTDGHGLAWHHGLGRRRDPWAHALTGVVVEGEGRAALWDAIYARRTFATSGARMVATLEAAGTPMGGEGTAKAPVRLAWRVQGTQPLTRLRLVRDGAFVKEVEVHGPASEGTWTDPDVAPGPHVYWLRARQGEGLHDADLAWTSPVFVDVR